MKDDLIELPQPKTLEECFKYLDEKLQDIDEFKNTNEENIHGISHFSLGLWMRNNWYLWWSRELAENHKHKNYPQEKPLLVAYFNDELNIHHADDMSGIIIESYHRYINGKDLNLESQIKKYHNHWLNNGNNG